MCQHLIWEFQSNPMWHTMSHSMLGKVVLKTPLRATMPLALTVKHQVLAQNKVAVYHV